jgi:hypothetical protein
MQQRSIATRVTRICAVGAMAAGLGITGAGPALAAPQAPLAASASAVTMRSCSGDVCETVTLRGNTITVTTTARRARHCITPRVIIVARHVRVVLMARPSCNQTHPHQRFIVTIRNLPRPVIVFAQWSKTFGEPSVIFR